MPTENEKLKEQILRISGVNPLKCMRCGKCSGTCPSYDEMEYHPHQFVYMVESGDIEPVVTELAAMLSDNKNMLVTEKLDWIYHSTACRAAIKAGDKTSPYEMQKFVEKLLSMPDIRYCPHGRPVLIEMSKREIEKNFGRV